MSYLTQKNSVYLQKTALASAIGLALSGGLAPTEQAVADTYTYDADVTFTMIDGSGNILENTSKPNGRAGNNFQTQTTGTLTFDTTAGTGSATIAPFDFFAGTSPATAKGVIIEDIGSNQMLTNMLFDWNGTYNIPVSLVWDASGLLGNLSTVIGSTVSAVGGIPASDGSYTNATFGNLALGPTPLATTTFNTTNSPACETTVACGATTDQSIPGILPSGLVPTIVDSDKNYNKSYGGPDVFGMGGNPMQGGPFSGFNANFDFTTLTLTGFTDTTPPVLALNGATPVNLAVGASYVEQGATCNDAIDGNLDGSVGIGGDTVPDPATAGTYTITYDCQDSSLNDATQITRQVNVTAAGTPTITLTGATPIDHEAATPYTDQGATCNDPDDGAIAPLNGSFTPPQDFSSVSTVDVNVPGPYTVTYSCTDSGGNAAPDVVRDVNVQDTTPPVITLTPACSTGAGAITQIADGTDPTPAATAVDPNFDTDLTSSIVQTGDTVDPSPEFGSALSITYNIAFNVGDAAGNLTVDACQIDLGNPDPVATLIGNSTVVLDSGSGFNDPGASCADFVDGTLPDATPDQTLPAGTPNGAYTITYTCTNSAGNTGTTTRLVLIGTAFSAASDSGSNFTMIDPDGGNVGGADDVFFTWTGSLYNDPVTQTEPNMFMGSAEPQPFFGFPWEAHDIRAFAPGSYTFTTSRGNTLQLEIGENQIGAHMLFDWNNNNDIDVVLAWDMQAVFTGSLGVANDLGAKGNSFTLASIDANGDGIPGVQMADGPFANFNANFSLKLTPQFALPDASASTAQGSNNPTSIIVSTTDAVTVTASVDPNVNDVYTYAGPFTYDWSTSDQALLDNNSNGTTSSTFVVSPSSLADGAVTARVKVRDGATGLTSTVEVPLQVVSGNLTDLNVQDSDNDVIPDSQDNVNNVVTPNFQQAVSRNGATFLLQSSDGTLILGDLATNAGTQSGVYQAGVTESDIGVQDPGVTGSCIGGCFSFKVTGLTPGAAVDVVLPLWEAIPADAGFRKFINGQWRNFVTNNGNAIMSSAGSAGTCPSTLAGDWTAGLTAGDFCVKLTIVDGGENDADGLANGTVLDPSGVSGASTGTGPIPGDVQSPNTGGGCSVASTSVNAGKRADWWLVAGFLGILGWMRRLTRH